MPASRIDEILDRLAEMELALPGLADHSPTALRYLARELDALVEECALWSLQWREALCRSQELMRTLVEIQTPTPRSHTKD